MLSATDRKGNPLFVLLPHMVLHRIADIGPAFPVLVAMIARSCGHGRVDGGRPVSRDSIAADVQMPVATTRRHFAALTRLGILIPEPSGVARCYRIAAGFFRERPCGANLRSSAAQFCAAGWRNNALDRTSNPHRWQQLELAIDVVDVVDERKKAAPAPPAARSQGRTEPPTPRAPRPPGEQDAPWRLAVRDGLNGTAGRRPEVVRAVLGAVGRHVRDNPGAELEAVRRAVEQYRRTIVDRGLFPGVSPWAYLPAAIRGKAWDAVEDRIEADAGARRLELARERSEKKRPDPEDCS